MDSDDKAILAAGASGVVALNLRRGARNPPLDLAFATLAQAQRVQVALRDLLAASPEQRAAHIGASPALAAVANLDAAIPADADAATWQPRIFTLRFFSRQDGSWDQRTEGDPTQFGPDRNGQVAMDGFRYLGRADASAGPGCVMLNVDYGWYDPASDSWFHADHAEPGMSIYQSTLSRFSRPLRTFDRQVFCVALARVAP